MVALQRTARALTDRFRVAAETLFSLILPRVTAALAPYAKWEFRVTQVTPVPVPTPPIPPATAPGIELTLPIMISATPLSAACPYGQQTGLSNITLWPGPDGSIAVPQVGSTVLVEFHEGNPAKPAVCGFDPQNPPQLVMLAGATIGYPVVTTESPVAVSGAAGVISSGSSKVYAPPI